MLEIEVVEIRELYHFCKCGDKIMIGDPKIILEKTNNSARVEDV